jgi:hypothetical protein
MERETFLIGWKKICIYFTVILIFQFHFEFIKSGQSFIFDQQFFYVVQKVTKKNKINKNTDFQRKKVFLQLLNSKTLLKKQSVLKF